MNQFCKKHCWILRTVFKNDPDHHKAKIAQEKLQKRLSRFGFQRFSETIAPWVTVALSIIAFFMSQYGFFVNGKITSDSSYALLTFGSILLVVAGLFLPHVLKLKVGAGGIELEKSPVEQITTSSWLEIKNQSESPK